MFNVSSIMTQSRRFPSSTRHPREHSPHRRPRGRHSFKEWRQGRERLSKSRGKAAQPPPALPRVLPDDGDGDGDADPELQDDRRQDDIVDRQQQRRKQQQQWGSAPGRGRVRETVPFSCEMLGIFAGSDQFKKYVQPAFVCLVGLKAPLSKDSRRNPRLISSLAHPLGSSTSNQRSPLASPACVETRVDHSVQFM